MNMDLLLCRRHYSHKIFLLWMTLQCLLRALFLLYLIKIYCWDIIFSIFYAKNYQVCLGSQTQIAFIRFQQRLVLLLSRTFFLFSYLFCIPCGKKKFGSCPPPRARRSIRVRSYPQQDPKQLWVQPQRDPSVLGPAIGSSCDLIVGPNTLIYFFIR